MEEHSGISPSIGKRIINCPGSRNLCKGIESKPSIYADEGSLAHFLSEWALKNGTNTDKLNDTASLGATVPDINPDLKIDQEMIDYTQEYVDVIRADLQEGMVLSVENKLDLSWIYPGMKGRCDASIGEFMGLLKVYDFKYGKGIVVEPEENEQSMLYALGELGDRNINEYEEVEIVIVQPRAIHPHGPVRRWRVTVEELYSFAKYFGKAAKITESPDALLAAGEWCQFCPAMPVCPEVVREAANSAMIEFNPTDPIEEVVTDITLPSPDTLTELEVAKVLDFSKIVGTWVKSVEAYALSRMESGVKFPGWKLVAKRSHRKWVDENAIIEFLNLQYGKAIYTDPKLKSPAQMEKLIGIDKKVLASYWEKPDAANTIAPESDKREAVAPSAVDDFANDLDFLESGEDDFLA